MLSSGTRVAALEELGCVDVYKMVADLVHHGGPAVFSTLDKGIPVQFSKNVGDTSWGLSRIVVENKTGRC